MITLRKAPPKSNCIIADMIISSVHWYGDIECIEYEIYEVWIHDFRKISIKKTIKVRLLSVFSFSQYGRWRSSRTSGSALITAGVPWWSSLPRYFSYPPLSASRRPPEWEWSRPARSSPLDASQRVRMLFKTVKEARPPALRPPCTSWIAPSSSQRKTVWPPTLADFFESFRLFWERREPFWPTRHGPERVSWHFLAGHSPFWRPYRQ